MPLEPVARYINYKLWQVSEIICNLYVLLHYDFIGTFLQVFIEVKAKSTSY